MSQDDFRNLASKLENSLGYAAPEIRTEAIAEALREAYNLGRKDSKVKVRLVADPPWGHWHEQYITLLERELTTWIACTHANIEHHPTEALFRFTWSMPESMSVVYSPWKPSILDAALAAKETYETKVKPFGTPEP